MDPLLHYVLQMKSNLQQKQDMENKMPIDIVNTRIAGTIAGPSPPRLEPMIDQEPNTETIKDRPGICANAATIGGWRTLSRVSTAAVGLGGTLYRLYCGRLYRPCCIQLEGRRLRPQWNDRRVTTSAFSLYTPRKLI